jgi:hypothetical protein
MAAAKGGPRVRVIPLGAKVTVLVGSSEEKAREAGRLPRGREAGPDGRGGARAPEQRHEGQVISCCLSFYLGLEGKDNTSHWTMRRFEIIPLLMLLETHWREAKIG